MVNYTKFARNETTFCKQNFLQQMQTQNHDREFIQSNHQIKPEKLAT